MDTAQAFSRLLGIVEKLRGRDGCPWDREQTAHSLRGNLIEETYECIEAINEGNSAHIREELGDLFLLITMISHMHEEEGVFSVSSVLNDICEKLIRRHPHVFGELQKENREGKLNSDTVLDNWNRIKETQEGRKPKSSALDGISKALPPLETAFKLQKKAAKLGFDWPDIKGVLDKVREELSEVEEVLMKAQAVPDNSQGNEMQKNALEEELGDLLFSVVNLCRFLKTEPSLALHKTNVKFISRFGYVEKKMKECGKTMEAANLDSIDSFWNETKQS